MYINWFTWIIFIHDCICYTKKLEVQELYRFSQRNIRLPLPQRKQGNYLVIPIYAFKSMILAASSADADAPAATPITTCTEFFDQISAEYAVEAVGSVGPVPEEISVKRAVAKGTEMSTVQRNT